MKTYFRGYEVEVIGFTPYTIKACQEKGVMYDEIVKVVIKKTKVSIDILLEQIEFNNK